MVSKMVCIISYFLKILFVAYFEISNENELQAYIYNKTSETMASWSLKQFGHFLLPYDIDDETLCALCPLVVDGIIFERNMGMTDIQMEAEVVYFCSILKIEDDDVCQGVIELNGVSTHLTNCFYYCLNVTQ